MRSRAGFGFETWIFGLIWLRNLFNYSPLLLLLSSKFNFMGFRSSLFLFVQLHVPCKLGTSESILACRLKQAMRSYVHGLHGLHHLLDVIIN